MTIDTKQRTLQPIAQIIEQAIAMQRNGHIDEAEQLYRAALATEPKNADALHNLGVLWSKQRAQPTAALPLFKAALEAHPAGAQYWLSYAQALLESGQPDEARLVLDEAIRRGLSGDVVNALKARIDAAWATQPDMATLRLLGERGEAIELEHQTRAQIAHFGETPALRFKLGEALLRQDRDAEALPLLEQACLDFPQEVDAWNMRALTLNHLERFNEAHGHYLKALELSPDDEQIHANIGDNFNDALRFEESVTWLRQAQQKHPKALGIRVNLANALVGLERGDEARSILAAVVAEGHRSPQALQSYGALLRLQGEYAQAEVVLRQALELAPNSEGPLQGLASVLGDSGRAAEGVPILRQILAMKPENLVAQSCLLFGQHYLEGVDVATHLLEAGKYGELVRKRVKTPYSQWQCPELELPTLAGLRIGFVSGDLRAHPVGYFLESLLGQLGRNRLRLFAYSSSPQTNDHQTTRLRPWFHQWTNLCGLNDEEAARRIHADGIHILFDLSGHTAKTRLPMFAYRPAPVQVSWLGYFATTGVAEIDYVLADEIGVPELNRHQFFEEVAYLPDTRLCFTPPLEAPDVAPLPALAKGSVTFGCFQNLTKVSDEVLRLWLKILNALSGSTLRVQAKQLHERTSRGVFAQRLAKLGFEPTQFELHGLATRKDYLAAHGAVDIILDTFPYPGGTTTCEALWMGVPTLTLAGDNLLARQGASLLTAAGLQNWVVNNQADYLARALARARDLPALATLRQRLRQQVAASPLFDAERFALNLEQLLLRMWQARGVPRLQGQPPHALSEIPAPAICSTSAREPAQRVPKLPIEMVTAPSDAAQLQASASAQLLAHFNAGETSAMEALARQMTQTWPDYAFGWKALGVALKRSSRLKEAMAPIQHSIALLPEDAEGYNNLGAVYLELHRYSDAEQMLREALQRKPDYADALKNLGAVLHQQQRYAEAEVVLRHALRLRPDYAEAYNNLGSSLLSLGRLEESEVCLRQALQVRPNYRQALSNLGSALQRVGRLDEAEAVLRRALALEPDYLEALNNLGVTLLEQGALEEAEQCLRQALQQNPEHAETLSNLGVSLVDQGRLQEGEAVLRHALAIKPDNELAQTTLLFSLNYLDQHLAEERLAQARRYGALVQARAQKPLTQWSCLPADGIPKKLRVGLVSGDFRAHPVGYFLEGVLNHLSSEHLELVAYNASPKPDDALSARIKPAFAVWRNVYRQSDESVAQQVAQDGVHLLLDLSGHTSHNRLPLFAWKPAPVQASWLGYFATTGVAQIDYLLADKVSVPARLRGQFTEAIHYLPESRLCFTPPADAPTVAPAPSLAKGHITFGCFQNMTKVSDSVLAVWAQILKRLPTARLRLQGKQFKDEKQRKLFGQRLERHGIALTHVDLCPPVRRTEYLAAHAEVDIILDTFPYPGGTTTCEALWMGVPTVTLAGESMIARQGASLMTAAGLSSWVTSTTTEYVDKALAWATDFRKLARLRMGLRDKVRRSALFDGARFARQFETALWEMWCDKMGGKPPRLGQRPSQVSTTEVKPIKGTKAVARRLPGSEDVQRAVVLFKAGRYDEAEELARLLTAHYPEHGFSWNILGAVLKMLERQEEAIDALTRAAELMPDDAEAQNNLGAVLNDLERRTEAEPVLRRAIELKPDYVEPYNNLGAALKGMHRLDEAEATLRQALALRPAFADAWYNLGGTLNEAARPVEAEQALRRTLELRPDFHRALGVLLFMLNYLAELTPQARLADARCYGAMLRAEAGAPYTTWRAEPAPRKLRVGFVSGDFRDHPVGYFLESVLRHLNRERVEPIAYSAAAKEDAVTERLRPLFAQWHSLVGISDVSVARRIHEDAVHVLIDLSGHTGYQRLPVFARKPAPVQASWLGYFATTGVAEIDYVLADETGVPVAQQGQFVEKVWYLPETRLCFTPPDTQQQPAPLPALQQGYITFACFQNLSKVSDNVLALWSRVLAAVPNAHLRLQSKQLAHPQVRRQLAERLQAQGIPMNRVAMHGPCLREEYLAAHAEVDIILDTFPYPGGTTTCEALWMGVPTLTLAGDTLIARQGASLLTAAGLADWVADSEDEYVAKAAAFALDTAALARLRVQLRQKVAASPLFDAERFARNFESALWGMWHSSVIAQKIQTAS